MLAQDGQAQIVSDPEPLGGPIRQSAMAGSPRRPRPVVALGAALLLGGCLDVSAAQQPPGQESRGGPFTLYTHCGVESAHIDGRWWHAETPLHDEDRTGPPEGWNDPFQDGTLVVESAERAVFEAPGRRVVFRPAPDDQPVRRCQ